MGRFEDEFCCFDAFCLPKNGCSQSDYEDAYSIGLKQKIYPDCVSFAIADGATESSYSHEWAQELADQYSGKPGQFYSNAIAGHIQRIGLKFQKQIIDKRINLDAPWYATHKATEGTYAALLGITLERSSRRFRALAIGDCCLFQIRQEKLIRSFPIEHSSEFNNRPFLLSSSSSCNSELLVKRQKCQFDYKPNDQLLLITDALACWFLGRHEAQDDVTGCLSELQTQDEFTSFIAKERHKQTADQLPLLRNDDVTLVRCQIR